MFGYISDDVACCIYNFVKSTPYYIHRRAVILALKKTENFPHVSLIKERVSRLKNIVDIYLFLDPHLARFNSLII